MQGETVAFEISERKTKTKNLGMLGECVVGYKAIYKQNDRQTSQGWASWPSTESLYHFQDVELPFQTN